MTNREYAEMLIEYSPIYGDTFGMYTTPDYELFYEGDENAYEDAIAHTIEYLTHEGIGITMPQMIMKRLENDYFGKYTIPVYSCVYHYADRSEQGLAANLWHTCYTAVNNAKFFTPEVETAEVLRNVCILLWLDTAQLEYALDCKLKDF